MAKLLLVEDDQALALQVCDALKSRGYLVDAASSAAEAYHLVRLTNYDLVILYWESPNSTGLAIFRDLRSSLAKKLLAPHSTVRCC